MRKIICRLLTLLMIFLAPMTLGEAISSTEGRDVFWRDTPAPNQEERREAARFLLALARQYDSNFLILRPVEQSYVLQELQNLALNPSGGRSTAFINSREYRIWRAREDLGMLVANLQVLERQAFSSEAEENRVWARAAYYLLSPDLYGAYRYLLSQGEIETHIELVSTGQFYGRQVLLKMIAQQSER